MLGAISVAITAAVIGGVISGAVVLLGVLLAELLKRQREDRQRRFELLLAGRSVMDEFIGAIDNAPSGQATLLTQRAGNALQEHVLELSSLNKRIDLRHPLKRAGRAGALNDFLLKLSAARVRLLINGVVLRKEELEALKASMVAYELAFGAGGPAGNDREIVDRYIKHGIDGGRPPDT